MQGQRGQDFETAARGRHSFRFLGPRPNDRLSLPVKEAAYRAAIHLNPRRGVERLAHFLQAALGIALMRAPQERLQSNPQRSLQEMCQSLYATLGIEVDRSTVGRFLHRVGESIVWPRPQEPERVTTSGGGFEILAALALHLGWVAHTAEVIAHSLARFRRSAAYRQERVGKDRKGRRAGRFTVAYNQRRDVREQRFASVEEKREDKNYSRMGLV